MPDRYHSRVFVAVAQIAADLEAATWPIHDTMGLPTVGVGDSRNPKPNETEVGEFVDVLYRVEDDASIEWARMSQPGKDERFLVDVYVRSSVAGVDRGDAWSRLEELAEVVQSRYWAPATGTFTPPAFPGVAPLGGVERVTPQMWRTDEGWAGDCIVTFRIAARI